MSDFYVDTLMRLLRNGTLHNDMKVLMVCAGEYDQDIARKCGFTNVTLSNLDPRKQDQACEPFSWRCEDAEQMSFADGEFEIAIAHSGLHHCRSPHRALLEMYRVCRTGLIVFEPSENILTRLGVRFGLGQEYELAAVAGTGGMFGGQRNTSIPNYVYRWTKREIEKTIYSYAPWGKHTFLYFHRLRIPWYRSQMMHSQLLNWIYLLLSPVANCIVRLLPCLSNNFAFVVIKPKLPEDLYPWLTANDGGISLNKAWVSRRYRL